MVKIFLICCVLFISCHPIEKALGVAKENPKEFAGFCAEAYPVQQTIVTRDSIHLDTIYKEGEPRIVDTIVQNDTVVRTVYFPGTTRFVTKTIYHDVVVTKKDSAALQAAINQRDVLITASNDLIGQRNNFHEGRDWWRKGALITWIALFLLIVGWVIAKIYAKK